MRSGANKAIRSILWVAVGFTATVTGYSLVHEEYPTAVLFMLLLLGSALAIFYQPEEK